MSWLNRRTASILCIVFLGIMLANLIAGGFTVHINSASREITRTISRTGDPEIYWATEAAAAFLAAACFVGRLYLPNPPQRSAPENKAEMSLRARDASSDPLRISLFAWKILIVMLSATSLILNWLTANTASQSANCAGQTWLLGVRSGMLDYFAPAIMSFLTAIMFTAVVTSAKIRQSSAAGDFEILRVGRMRITYGAFVTFAGLAGITAMFAFLAWISAGRYGAIARYCQTAAALY